MMQQEVSTDLYWRYILEDRTLPYHCYEDTSSLMSFMKKVSIVTSDTKMCGIAGAKKKKKKTYPRNRPWRPIGL
jgi:hypothetical protein